MDRRHFLKISGTTLAATSLAGPSQAAAREWARPEALSDNPFTLGVASGDPAANSISLWTRLAPDPLGDGGMPGLPAKVEWDISSRPDFADELLSGQMDVWPEFGHVVKPRIAGLQPGQTYYYRFRFGTHLSRVGQFLTAPAQNDVRPIRFALASCNRYEDGWFHAFRHINQDQVDFVFHAGDYIYEKASRADRMRPHGLPECFTLTEYRRRYALYKLDKDLQDLHASKAFISTWDDHEVAGNWAGVKDKWGTPDAVFAQRRTDAFQAYWEAMPFAVPPPAPGGELALYRRVHYGPNVNLLVLDTRQYRSDQACGDTTTELCEAAQQPGRTMLGQAQQSWLEDEIKRSRAAWTLIGQQVPSFLMDYNAGEPRVVSMDKWDGYPQAQKEFQKLLDQAQGPCVTLAGDVHQHIAAQRRHWQTGAPAGADLVATSVTSGGDGQDRDDAWETLQASNPDLVYNSRRRGYVLLEAGPERLDIDFRTLDRITDRAHRLYRSAQGGVSRSGQLTLREMDQLLREEKA